MLSCLKRFVLSGLWCLERTMDGQRIFSTYFSSQAANKVHFIKTYIWWYNKGYEEKMGGTMNYIINVSCLLPVVTLSGILKY